MSVLIWVQTVCHVDQKMTKVVANGKKKSLGAQKNCLTLKSYPPFKPMNEYQVMFKAKSCFMMRCLLVNGYFLSYDLFVHTIKYNLKLIKFYLSLFGYPLRENLSSWFGTK